MGGEYGVKLGVVDGRDNVLGGETGVEEASYGLIKPVSSSGLGLGQVVDAMNLLGRVRQMKVGGERSYQLDCFDQIDIAENIGQCGRGAVVSAQSSSVLADLFNSFEKLGSSLADERVAKLSAESTNVVTERGVEFGGSVRHLRTVAGTARG